MNNKLLFVVTILLISLKVTAQEMRDPFIPLLKEANGNETVLISAKSTPQKIVAPLVEKIFTLTSVSADTALQQLQQTHTALLSNEGFATSHSITNSLVIKDTAIRLKLIEDWLKQLDVPKQQVQITAHIISSSRTALQELGLEWGMLSGSPNNKRYQRYNRYDSTQGQFNFNLLRLGEGLLELKLNALEKENLLSIIASPRLMASHKHPASIQQGTEIPYVTSTEKTTNVQFKDAVLGMEVTPTLSRGDQVELLLKISHNSPDTALTTSESNYLAINKQEIATSVTIRNNETLILGGIFQQKQEKTETGFPFLSDIPLLGKLFTSTGKHIDRRILVVFITPKLISI
ncbi:transporter [Providencia vermicola]|uniref:secretin N-terminal domain-containing protein n=1 Tax=Providencia vermicola TaxID=333965 RepID=UPI0013A79BCC|nr:secretin N-terminal domain-containing protein [Providencia vermicola]QIC14255.1 transporter [Providencia vermicola]